MTKVKLGDYVNVDSGYSFKSKLFNDTEGIPIIRIRDVNAGVSKTYYSGEYSEKYIVNNGDLLITMDGEFNIREWNGGKALLNQRVCRITSSTEMLNKKYLLYLLPKVLKDIEDKTPFVTVKHLSVKEIVESLVYIPNVSVQNQIIEVLDIVNDLINKRKDQIAKLSSLASGIFWEMFGDPITNSKNYEYEKLRNLAHKITDGTHHSPPMVDQGVPYISAKHLGKGKLDFYRSPAYVSEEDHRKIYNRCDPQRGDVLYIKDGATTGIAGVNHYDFQFSMLSSLALIKCNNDKINNIYLV